MPGSSLLEISLARILEQVAISYSRRSSWPRDQICVSSIFCTGTWNPYCLYHLEIPFIRSSIKLSKNRSVLLDSLWSHGLDNSWSSSGQNTAVDSFIPPPENLPNPGIEPGSPALQVDYLPTELSGKPHTTNCRSQQTVENSSKDGNTTPLDLPLKKMVYRSRNNS